MSEKKTILGTVLAKKASASGLTDYADDAVISKQLISKKVGTVTMFAFDKGQQISTHSAPYDAMVQILDGTAEITIAEEKVEVSAGELIILPANIPHGLVAIEQFKMILTMIKA